MSLEDLTNGLRDRVGDDAGLDARVKFDFGDDGMIFIDGASTPNTVSNEDAEADCTISITMEDFQSMSAGELDPTSAFMTGKLKVAGNMAKLMMNQAMLGAFANAAADVDVDY